MTPTNLTRWHAALACACLATAPLYAADAVPLTEKGDLWEVTTQMSMEGMDMALPSQTNRVCTDKAWKKPPVGGGDRGCEMQNVTNTGTKTTWKMSCSGPPAMQGEGEITRSGPDDYAGFMKMSGAEGAFRMNLAGHRVGECDVAAAKKDRAATIARAQAQVDAGQKMQADATVAMCNNAADSLDMMTLSFQGGPCVDPAYKTRFCSKFQTREGFEMTAERPVEYGTDASAKYCGADAAAMKKSFCAEAVQKKDYAYVSASCPDDVAAIAEKECGGRDGSAFWGSPLGQLCRTYAESSMNQQKEAKPETKKEKSKKILKGIFP